MPTTGRVRGYLWVNILTPWADSSMLFRSERHALLFLFINHAPRMLLRSFWLILRRTNKLFRKGVDSFSTLPIMRLHTAGVISSAGRAPPLQGGGRRFDPVITHHFGSLAQLVEQLTFNQLVAGSNPARPTIFRKKRLQALFSFLSTMLNRTGSSRAKRDNGVARGDGPKGEQSALSCPSHQPYPSLYFLDTTLAATEARFTADTADRQFCPRSAYFPLHARLPITPARR